jgi:hypothetical protein
LIRKWTTLPAAAILCFCLQQASFAQAPAADPDTNAASAIPAAEATVQLAALNTSTSAIPDAPTPVQQSATTQHPDLAQQTGQQIDKGFYFLLSSKPSKYSTTVKPGQKFVPFMVKEKFVYSARESVSPEAFFVIFWSAGYNHLIDGNPHAGSDSAGFGERVGYIALRDTSVHIISDGIYASLFHQDERYFRQGPGNKFKSRAKHAVLATFTAHRDRDGSAQFDYSGILGRASASYLTMTYYPHISATPVVASTTFGYSLAGELFGNAFLEFWPDVVAKLTHGKKY